MDLMDEYYGKRSPQKGDSFLFLGEYRTVIVSMNSDRIWTLEEDETSDRKITLSLRDYETVDLFFESLKFRTLGEWKKYFVSNDMRSVDDLIGEYKKTLKGEIGKRKLKILRVILDL